MLHNNNLKTFFLFPQKLVFEDLAEMLVERQNEAFVLNNHVQFRDALKIFNEKSLAFINIDSVLTEAQWIAYIKDLRADSHYRGVRFGILSFNRDQRLMDLYKKELKIECGYHILSRKDRTYEKNIFSLVDQYREREGNKVLRLDFTREDPVNFQIKSSGKVFKGRVDSMSSAAMSITVPDERLLFPSMELHDLTLSYRDLSCRIIGTVIGNSKLNKKQFIIKFQRLFEDFHQKTLFSIIYHVLNNNLKEMVK